MVFAPDTQTWRGEPEKNDDDDDIYIYIYIYNNVQHTKYQAAGPAGPGPGPRGPTAGPGVALGPAACYLVNVFFIFV